MMRSLFSGVSGLKNHQTKMDGIGNNISNVNTHGFKRGRTNFKDMLYQNLSGATRPTEDVGGINPKQVGLGMSIASIDTIHTQGALETTGVRSDLAIKGDGFFVLRKGENALYTRNGVFSVDSQGMLVNPGNGLRVQGWSAQEINGVQFINTSGDPGDIEIPLYGKIEPRATTRVDLACNLDKNLPVIPPGATQEAIAAGTWTVNKTIYDTFGNEHTMRMDFVKTVDAAGVEVPNSWTVTVLVDADDTGADTTNTVTGIPPGALAIGDPNTFTVNFDNNGSVLQVTDGAGNPVAGAIDPATGLPLIGANLQVQVAFDAIGGNPDAAGALPRQTVAIDIGDVGDFSDSVTQDASKPSSKAVRQDGYTLGYLTDYEIDQRGVVIGAYDNGVRRELAQLSLATFTNPGGLEKVGDVNFRETINSGEARINEAETAGKGSIIAGTLEMSNVDLAQEFVDMITTQRGFQANSRTIQTSDQMLQELLTLKR